MNTHPVERKVALVTGGGKRIGAWISRKLADQGWQIVIHCSSSHTDAAALAHEISLRGGRAAVVESDLADRSQVDGLIEKSSIMFGPPTLLVNNASAFERDDLTSMTWESWDKHLGPNLAAPIFLAKKFFEKLSGDENGNVINILDQKVANLNPDFFSYTVSKVGLAGATQMLAMALGPRIRVNSIAPGLTLISGKQTPEGFERAWRDTPLQRSSTPDEIAAAVLTILSLPSMTGQTLFLDGGESLRGRPRDVAFFHDVEKN